MLVRIAEKLEFKQEVVQHPITVQADGKHFASASDIVSQDMGKAVRGLTMLSKSRPLPDVFVDQMTLIIHPSRHHLPLSLITVNFLINLGFLCALLFIQ